MIWGSCVIVEALLAVMGGMFLYKASSEEDQEGADALSADQVSVLAELSSPISVIDDTNDCHI